MLWYKAWLETRARFALMAGIVLFSSWYLCPEILGKMMQRNSSAPSGSAWQWTLGFLWFLWPLIAITFGGAGINTQTFSGAAGRPHPSMLFTLSLPVTRRRLVGIRAATGAAETVVLICFTCMFLWSISPALRSHTGLNGICFYMIVTSVGVSVFYCLSVLYATFLNETWQFNACWVTTGAIVMLRVLPIPLPVRMVIGSLSDVSQIVRGELPWPSLMTCALISAALLWAAVHIAERKTY